MLLEFSCSNHRSIRSPLLFSTLAGKDEAFADRIQSFSSFKVLKGAVIYGANGSGKSNLLDAIAFVRNLVVNSINHQPGQGIRQLPHKLEGFAVKSSYKIQFVTEGLRYVFGFSLQNMLVSDEYLYCFPRNRQSKVYERSGTDFVAGRKYRGSFSACKDVLKPNRLLLSCAANFSPVPEVAAAFNFFANELVVYTPSSQGDWLLYSLYQMNANPPLKAAVLTFLAELGTGIKDIQVAIDQKQLQAAELPPFLSAPFKAQLLQENFNTISAKVVYEHFATDLLQEESAGVKKLFAILCPLLDIMLNGKVLLCDELDSGLHEALVYGLVKLFLTTKTGKFAQLIFTTHETGLLSLELFRRDEIWFTELNKEDRATDLYSLAEIKHVRKEENIGRGYIAGKYGAIPMLNLNFAHIVEQL